MSDNPIVLIHGYSDEGPSFNKWRDLLKAQFPDRPIHICNYVSLNNEITIKDLAEGLDRTLRQCAGLDKDQDFDAVVHSTGMLVIRAWLAVYAKRRSRLKRLIGLAPATFGSPLAHKGRSWLGAVFKGSKHFGPDFLNAGDLILDGLELASRLTWDLAHADMVGGTTSYGMDGTTPYVFIFCGNEPYGGLRALINEPGTDGTVRWAGTAMNSRKITFDLSRDDAVQKRIIAGPWQDLDIPVHFVDGLNHATILGDPTPDLQKLVFDGFQVTSAETMAAWATAATAATAPARVKAEAAGKWQQFVVRAVDDRGDPITDYNLEVLFENNGLMSLVHPEASLSVDVHAYTGDKSLRCFHVNLNELSKVANLKSPMLRVRVIASTGSALVTYSAFPLDTDAYLEARTTDEQGNLDIEIPMAPLFDQGLQFFWPYTTTLIELRITREPTPLDRTRACPIFKILGP